MIEVKVPATSANCCIGFDTLGMALDWFGTFRFEPSETLEITGCPREYQTQENLVVQAFQRTCDYLKKEMPAFHLDIDMDLPFSRGLGSSACCIVAGILACDAWFAAQLNKMEILQLATKLEGHPDNVAPAIFGQACTSFVDEDGISRMMMLPCANYQALLMIPSYPIVTKEARKVLPDTISHKQATQQVSHALSFALSLNTGNELMLKKSCKDYLHEPYRSLQIKEYDEVHALCEQLDLAMWISGSGSTMLALSLESVKLDRLKSYVEAKNGLSVRLVRISKKGAFVSYE